MSFKIGDNVEVIDELLSGVIVEILKGQKIKFLDSKEGFHYIYHASKLVKSGFDLDDFCKDIEIKDNKKVIYNKINIMQVDLHIEELTEHYSFLLPHQIFCIQLNKVKECLFLLEEKKVLKVIFIHGIGKGILKFEIQKMVEKKEFLECFPSPNIQLYGNGATEVRLKGVCI